jgi:hypothetical protein
VSFYFYLGVKGNQNLGAIYRAVVELNLEDYFNSELTRDNIIVEYFWLQS